MMEEETVAAAWRASSTRGTESPQEVDEDAGGGMLAAACWREEGRIRVEEVTREMEWEEELEVETGGVAGR